MIIKGKELSLSIKEALKVRVEVLGKQYGRTPNLVVILVGDDPGSVSYVTGKAKAADQVGIRNTTIRREATISESDLLELIEQLNQDDDVDGILVQLPLPFVPLATTLYVLPPYLHPARYTGTRTYLNLTLWYSVE